MDRNNERLSDLISPIVSDRGLSLRTASFGRPKEFQATWKRSGNVVEIMISDYLADAPDDVITDFFGGVADTIIGKRPRYGIAFLNWVRSDEFISGKRKIYLRRSRNLRGTPQGNERDLIASLDRLLDSGHLSGENIDNSFFSWTKNPNVRKVGYCSPMMRVVGVSSVLDDASVPEFVLDYVVYHESLHLARGYRPGERAHDRSFRTDEKRYEGHEEAERFLKDLGARKKVK
ncbi:MAG: hypothetical protein LBP82_00710 [Candidatus Methanoplasma sp.]|jgi:hypothetical protein|nr:hypothetical protein [Candidatus Methanoplasma sp.]